jgi:hypothetical protein
LQLRCLEGYCQYKGVGSSINAALKLVQDFYKNPGHDHRRFCIIVSDSQARDLRLNGFLNVVLPGSNCLKVSRAAETYCSPFLKSLIIWAGTCNLGFRQQGVIGFCQQTKLAAWDDAKEYNAVLNFLKESYPELQLVVFSVLPRHDFGASFNRYVFDFVCRSFSR